jgi:transposase-like protein
MKASAQPENAVEHALQSHPATFPAARQGQFSPARHARDKRQYATWAALALSVAAPLLAFWVRAVRVRETAERPEPPKAARTPAPSAASAQTVFPDVPPTRDLAGGAATSTPPSATTMSAERLHAAPASRPRPAEPPRGGDVVESATVRTDGGKAPPIIVKAVQTPTVVLAASNIPTGGAGQTGRVEQRPTAVPPPPTPAVRPVTIVADSQLAQLLTEAWGLIERGDYEPARARLEKARKRSHDDMRADFSLGLLDALVTRDWLVAEKRFEACLRRDPTCVAVLNNLAIAETHNRRPTDAVKRWRAILDRNAATAEVVQNLGRVRHLIKEGQMPKNAAVIKAVDELYAQAAIAAAATWQSQVGFRVMPLPLPNGQYVGFTKQAWRMNDLSWSGPQASPGRSKPPPAASAGPAATYPAVTYPEAAYPTPMPPGALYPASSVYNGSLQQPMNIYGGPGAYPAGAPAPAAVPGRPGYTRTPQH